jgi:hypothetical protein
MIKYVVYSPRQLLFYHKMGKIPREKRHHNLGREVPNKEKRIQECSMPVCGSKRQEETQVGPEMRLASSGWEQGVQDWVTETRLCSSWLVIIWKERSP